jgi:hypothetical protein
MRMHLCACVCVYVWMCVCVCVCVCKLFLPSSIQVRFPSWRSSSSFVLHVLSSSEYQGCLHTFESSLFFVPTLYSGCRCTPWIVGPVVPARSSNHCRTPCSLTSALSSSTECVCVCVCVCVSVCVCVCMYVCMLPDFSTLLKYQLQNPTILIILIILTVCDFQRHKQS